MKDLMNDIRFEAFESEMDRRAFMKAVSKYGFTAAVAAAGAGTLFSSTALAQTASEDAEREAAAEHIMTIGTAYVLGASRTMPIMQSDFKENIENFTNGKVYVKLGPGGSLSTGSSLAEKVQTGTIQAAQHSISNFAPFAPVADVINIPYWCGSDQKFTNLVNSDAWKGVVDPAIEAKGYVALWYVATDPRTTSIRKGLRDEPIKTPEDMKGIKFRVPGSAILQQLYRLLGANPTPVAWGETPTAIKQGVADGLDPSVMALNIFGFGDILEWVSFTAPVPDSQVYSCNLEWLRGLDSATQDGIFEAAEVTKRQNLAQIPAARAYAQSQMGAKGVKFYVPTADESAQWVAAAGHQLDVWNDTKKELAGSLAKFDELLEAAETFNGYFVQDVK